MHIIIGSANKAKINAVQHIFPDAEVTGVKVDSSVGAQPKTDKETRQGAINRAIKAKSKLNGTYGIGLEGGVMHVEDQLFLCNWGALVTPADNCFTASGARISLPREVSSQLGQGKELGEVMRTWTAQQDISQNLGAIGVFTNELISRERMFSHVVELLKGQAQYHGRLSDNI